MRCYIFDLDGVVTHVEEKTITNPHLVSILASILAKGELITINTGRSLPFIQREVLQYLPEPLLHNVFAVGEKGNAWIEDEKDYYDMSDAIPKELAETVYVYREKEHPLASFDRAKRTMVSVESKKGISLDAFAPEKEKIREKFTQLLEEFHLTQDFVLDTSISAIDIQHKTAGKEKGMERIFTWLAKRNVDPEEFIAFGDSVADIGTGEALQKANKNFTFIFVGNPNIIQHHPEFPITFTHERYDKGVIEYFSIDNKQFLL